MEEEPDQEEEEEAAAAAAAAASENGTAPEGGWTCEHESRGYRRLCLRAVAIGARSRSGVTYRCLAMSPPMVTWYYGYYDQYDSMEDRV